MMRVIFAIACLLVFAFLYGHRLLDLNREYGLS
jgi:hypothetical protein